MNFQLAVFITYDLARERHFELLVTEQQLEIDTVALSESNSSMSLWQNNSDDHIFSSTSLNASMTSINHY